MSHTCGRVVGVGTRIGPDSGAPPSSAGVWEFLLTPSPAVLGGTARFVMLHFDTMSFPGSSRLEVDLRYGIDTFNAASSADGWTRPIYPLPRPHPDSLLRRRTERRCEFRRVRDWLADEDPDARGEASTASLTNVDLFLHTNPYTILATSRDSSAAASSTGRTSPAPRPASSRRARPGRSAALSAFTVTAPPRS